MQLYTSDKTSPRSFKWLWFIRLVALIITIIVLGITAFNTATFHDIGCDAPAKLLYNLAVSIISFVALIYLILASGPNPATRIVPWFIWGQLVLDALFFVFWLSAGSASSYSCSDLCNACGILDGYVYFDGQSCSCVSDFFYKRDYSPRVNNVLQSRRNHVRDSSTVGGSMAAKQAFDAIMTLLFFIFIISDIIWIVKSRKTATTTASGPSNSVPMKNEEAAMPMGGVGAPTYTQQPGPEYTNNQTAPQGGYTAQPMQHQGGPPQLPVPQEQYLGSQYHQGQTQYPQAQAQHSPNQANHPNPTLYPQGEQAPAAQSYPSPQSGYPPQYAGSAPQQASYPGPRDGVSEMHSPTEAPQANNSHQV